MTHPTNEEWMSFLYDEVDAAERSRLTGHLQHCANCHMKITEWHIAQRHLDGWRLEPRKKARFLLARPVLRWAAAAAIFVGIGFGVGRLSTMASMDTQKLRAAIEPEIRQQLRDELVRTMREEIDKSAAETLAASREQTGGMLAEYGQKIENERAADNAVIFANLDQLDSQQADDYVSLKQQLDTVAVLTDAGLRQTENQVAELADYPVRNPAVNAPRNKSN